MARYQDIQRASHDNIENIRRKDNELLKKKHADYEFLSKMLENYRSFSNKIRAENVQLETTLNNIKALSNAGACDDNQLCRNILLNVKTAELKKQNTLGAC